MLAFAVAGCAAEQPKSASLSSLMNVSYSQTDRDCLARAIYFESHRGSDDGMTAVGTVVMNRLKSGAYGSTICEVVGQKGQFAAGVLTRPMDDAGAERARRVAQEIAAGKRNPAIRGAMFFHTAGLRFRYGNMHYVLVAGGNAFYEKREIQTAADAGENARSRALALAYARADPTAAAKPILVASYTPAAQLPPETPSVPVVLAAKAAAAVVAKPATPVEPAPAPVAAPVEVARMAPPETTAKPHAAEAAKPALAYAAAAMRPAAPKPGPRTIDVAQSQSAPAMASAMPAVAAPAPASMAWERIAGAFSTVQDPYASGPVAAFGGSMDGR